jgi:hypothetical protein
VVLAPFFVLIEGMFLLGCGCEFDEAYKLDNPEMAKRVENAVQERLKEMNQARAKSI